MLKAGNRSMVIGKNDTEIIISHITCDPSVFILRIFKMAADVD